MAQPPILSWEGLGLQQGGRWLFGGPDQDPIDLHIGARDRLALIGRNGAGKTTLFRLIDDRIEADRGLRKVKPGTRIVVLEQEPDLSGHATLMEWALVGDNPPQEHEVDAIAGQLGIDMATPTKGASGGERRRAAIARALCMEPEALLFDEPTSALDPELEQEVVKVIKDLAAEGRTMLIVTHDMKMAADVSDRVVFLHQGLIEEEGTPDAVFGAPKSERLRGFLSATSAA